MKIYANTNNPTIYDFIEKPVWVRGVLNDDGYEEAEYFKIYGITDETAVVNMLPADCVDNRWKLTSSTDIESLQSLVDEPLSSLNTYDINIYDITLIDLIDILTEEEN